MPGIVKAEIYFLQFWRLGSPTSQIPPGKVLCAASFLGRWQKGKRKLN
jgi:hypothetical protein